MRYAVHVEVGPLEGIANPEGQTIERALPALGFSGAEGVRVGKVLRFELEAPGEEAARSTVTEMCERLLANPVIEKYEVRLERAEEP